MRRNSRGMEVANAPEGVDLDTSSKRTTLRSTTIPGYGARVLQLIHATPGTELAGSILRWRANEGWLTTTRMPNGSTIGQWYATLAEAEARFDAIIKVCNESGVQTVVGVR